MTTGAVTACNARLLRADQRAQSSTLQAQE